MSVVTMSREAALKECRRMGAKGSGYLYLAANGRVLEDFWRDLIAPGQGQLGRRFFVFSGWCEEVLRSIGITGQTVGPLAAETVIEGVIPGKLSHFAPLEGYPGLVRGLADFFSSLRRCGLSPERFWEGLRETSPQGRIRPAEEEAARLYELFSREMDLLNLWVPGERTSRVLEALRSGNLSRGSGRFPEMGADLLSPGTLVWDGTAQTAIEAELVSLLCSRSERAIVVEPAGNSPPEDDKPRRFDIKEPDPSAELETAAETAFRLLEAGVVGSPGEIAFIFSRPSQRQAEIRRAFRLFGLPVDFRGSWSLAETPVFRAILAVLEAAVSGGEREACLAVIKSDYLDCGLPGHDAQPPVHLPADLIEEILLGLGPFQNTEQCMSWLGRRPGSAGLTEAARAIQAVAERAVFPERETLSALVSALERSLEDFSLLPSILRGGPELAARDLAAWRALRASLSEAALAAGERIYTLAAFRDLVHRCGEAVFVPGPSPRPDGIKVIPAREAAGLRFPVVFICGLTDGRFPSRDLEGGWILPEERRRQLAAAGLPLETHSERRLREEAWYWAATRTASDYLFLSDCQPGEAGAAPRAASRAETRKGGDPAFGAGIRAEAERWTPGEYGAFDGRISDPEVLEEINRDFGPGRVFSVSRLGPYGRCPFRFFCREVLALDAPEETAEGIDPRIRGDLSHRILFRFFRSLGQPLAPARREEYLKRLREIAAGVFAEQEAEGEYLNPGLWRVIREEILDAAAGLIGGELDRSAGSNPMMPSYFEVGFGLPLEPEDMDPISRAEPLEIMAGRNGDGTRKIRLRGKIDRIDLDPVSKRFVVYDYKTGTPPPVRDMLAGRDLQIPVYLLAASRLLGPGWTPAGGGYYSLADGSRSHGLYRRSDRDRLGISSRASGLLEDEAFEAAVEESAEYLARYIAEISRGDFAVRPSERRCPAYCAFREICRYDRRRAALKDGGAA